MEFCADIGSNHCGSLDSAVEHIKRAALAGATQVKFQYFRGELLTSNPQHQQDLKPFEVPQDWLIPLRYAAQQVKVQIGYSVFHPSLVRDVAPFADFLKVSAYDLMYQDLILECARWDSLLLVLSTAMATDEEVCEASRWVEPRHRSPIWWLTGTACYPCPQEEVHLARLGYLRDLVGPRVGFSDHTLGTQAAVAATLLGAGYVEKHFRVGECQGSPDRDHSISSFGFATMVGECNRVRELLGSPELGVRDCETPLLGARRTNQKPLRD